MPAVRSLFVSLGMVIASCEGTHGDLGQSTGASGGGGASTSSSAGAGGEGGTGGATPIEEPDLPDRLTLVHGSPDRDAVQFCFFEWPSRENGVLLPTQPLAFAEAHAISAPAMILNVAVELEVVVLAGDLEAVEGDSCEDIVESPPLGVDAASLGVLPADTFASMRSLALAVTGCFGTEESESSEAGCGPGYGPDTPTVFPVIAPLSRLTTPSKIGFSVLHASSGFNALDVRIVASMEGAQPVSIATQVPRGAALPFPPNIVLSSATLGAPNGASLRANSFGSAGEVMVSMQAALSNGSLASFDNGDNYVLVALGANPEAPSGFWSPFTFVVLRADPQ